MPTPKPLAAEAVHRFAIGTQDFLLDGHPLQIRCGEMHFARVPREYWRNRLQSVKAMGLNAVCAYLFWNFHEHEEGTYLWTDRADAAEFCRLAQEEGLWVILRPGPYACAEWDGGGLPWWLLKNPAVALRSTDPAFLVPATAWLREVGRVLGPLQVSRGGPILMVQAENEYGSYGRDAAYMGLIRQGLIDAGFDVPLFACNPPGALRSGWREDLFQVVNFSTDPHNAFQCLREVQPTGPLMCGEFYPGWFDTWGAPHHGGDTARYLHDLETMLEMGASFSIYMAHGGTTFGLWSGADRPFKPDTSSYDYDAPISEAGWTGEKFHLTRQLLQKFLEPGELLPEPPARLPVTEIQAFTCDEVAPLFESLPPPLFDRQPRHMEAYGQGAGCVLYRTILPAGPATVLRAAGVGDFAWVFVDGVQASTMDRRSRRLDVPIPARGAQTQLDILVEAMGHVNFGQEVHDRKGLLGPVHFGEEELAGGWQIYPLPLDAGQLGALQWKQGGGPARGPAFWRGGFDVVEPADTFLDLHRWGKGVVWINGHCLARFWNIGPTQTAFLPGLWLRGGRNEVVILDLLGPAEPVVAGVEKPDLARLRPELDFARSSMANESALDLVGISPVLTGVFEPGPHAREVRFEQPVSGRQFCLEALDAHDDQAFTAVAEIDLFGLDGQPISHALWSVVYADSEEMTKEDGSASNAIDGQPSSFWLTAWSEVQSRYPHQIVIDLGQTTTLGGFRYVPRAGDDLLGRIRHYRAYVGDELVKRT